MSIIFSFNETVSVKRLTDVAGTNKQIYDTHIAALSCHIQPLEPEISEDIDGGYGKNFLMFSAIDDVQEGDRIFRTVGEETKEYRVMGVERYDFQGHAHLEIIIRIFET